MFVQLLGAAVFFFNFISHIKNVKLSDNVNPISDIAFPSPILFVFLRKTTLGFHKTSTKHGIY